MNTPDKWIIVKMSPKDGESCYKVFASWYGGYLGADRWKMNSGIVKIEEDEYFFRFFGESGSCYECSKSTYGTNFFSQGVLEDFTKRASEVGHTIDAMPADTDWVNLLNKEDEAEN